MTIKERKFLEYVNRRIINYLNRNADKTYIAEWLDDIIYYLLDDATPELYSTLYRMSDNLLLGGENNN